MLRRIRPSVLLATLAIAAPGGAGAQPERSPSLALRVAAGAHSNVFLAAAGEVEDTFAFFEAEGERAWPLGGGQLLVHGLGSGLVYRDQGQADEWVGLADAWWFRTLSPRFSLALADLVSAVDLTLFDRRGDILPRGTFASLTNDAIATLDVSLARDVYLTLEGGFVARNYEEDDSLGSLDWTEPHGGAALTFYLGDSWSIRAGGGFSRRSYREFPSSSTPVLRRVEGDGPPLELDRGEVGTGVTARWNGGWSAGARWRYRREEDRFMDVETFDEHEVEVRIRNRNGVRTPLAASLRVVDRDFERQLVEPSRDAPLLEERFLEADLELEWPILTLGGWDLALWGRARWSDKSSSAPRESFDTLSASLGTAVGF